MAMAHPAQQSTDENMKIGLVSGTDVPSETYKHY
jgi:hypothetical protein